MKAGPVSSAERTAPPTVASASYTRTLRPACASPIAIRELDVSRTAVEHAVDHQTILGRPIVVQRRRRAAGPAIHQGDRPGNGIVLGGEPDELVVHSRHGDGGGALDDDAAPERTVGDDERNVGAVARHTVHLPDAVEDRLGCARTERVV